MWIAIAVVAVLVVAAVAIVLLTGRSGGGVGRLSRETRSRDRADIAASPGTALESTATGDARARAGEARDQASSGVPVVRESGAVSEWEPVDLEQLGVSRRQFFNRAILTVGGLAALPTLGAAILAFLWPSGAGGFGSKVTVKFTAAKDAWATKIPFYVPEARTYLQPYPQDDKVALAAAKSAYPAVVVDGMSKGVVALYQKCVHLGCKVPWCSSAQWFECPCHGSKYNRVGEKRDGPAPRGLDHWPVTIDGDNITIDTSGSAILGAPIGTDTTKQAAEGPHCV